MVASARATVARRRPVRERAKRSAAKAATVSAGKRSSLVRTIGPDRAMNSDQNQAARWPGARSTWISQAVKTAEVRTQRTTNQRM